MICRKSEAEVLVDLPQRRLGGYVIPDLTRHMRQKSELLSQVRRELAGERSRSSALLSEPPARLGAWWREPSSRKA
jgi:hypothetical protein